MPAFFHAEFWSLANPEFWVGAGLVIFLGIIVLVGAPKKIAQGLDAKAATIQADLDEAARIRAEAEALLKQIQAERAEAEAQAADILANAKEEARLLEVSAKAKLEESIARREQMAERRIAMAESQAAAEVKAAAADLAAQATEAVLADRLRTQRSDPQIDAAIQGLAGKLS
ncbi:MAG TPA: F0F1 ATP synthase subunit B [Caulobacteraceae bacterium]|nr:F0F1 ATP synthase subunit B [Caulobacteraceae bacterium]